MFLPSGLGLGLSCSASFLSAFRLLHRCPPRYRRVRNAHAKSISESRNRSGSRSHASTLLRVPVQHIYLYSILFYSIMLYYIAFGTADRPLSLAREGDRVHHGPHAVFVFWTAETETIMTAAVFGTLVLGYSRNLCSHPGAPPKRRCGRIRAACQCILPPKTPLNPKSP